MLAVSSKVPLDMKNFLSCIFVAALMLGLPSVSVAKGKVHPAVNNSGEAGVLSNAYHILETGDHDYNGHRIKAMHAIEEAAKPLGVHLHGDERDKTPQALSDAKLREVIAMLKQLHGAATGKYAKHIQSHVNRAISELQTALSIR